LAAAEALPLYAHTPGTGSNEFHCLIQHLQGVATYAEAFASKFGAEQVGRCLGLVHDLGKASPGFQRYLRQCYEGVPNPSKSPHSDPGAVAVKQIGLFTLCVQGHHGGIPSKPESKKRRQNACSTAVEAAKALASELDIPAIQSHPAMASERDAEHLLRLSFSALVDADYLDTEAHFSGRVERGHYPSLAEYRQKLEDELARFGEPVGEVNRVRREVQNACRAASDGNPGFFRLTVPTGGGKTLASLLFALRHAEKYGLDRVIVAIPFTSIIEQTADTYRRIFGDENVLEHHSAVAVADEESPQRLYVSQRLAAENWDCPLVVTTNVQLFESLLSNKPSKCRKLHNVARTVIVLDEAQSLPPAHIQSTTDVLGWMVKYAGCSVVFCTATQPDYSGIADVPNDLVQAREIVSEPERLFVRLKRVEFIHRGAWTHDDVARRLDSEQQALAILNTKADAAKVLAFCTEEAFYLSAWLCPDHRRQVLAEVRQRLRDGRPCRLVSTQVVEAGVDVDFPLVLRAMAPLDSLVQAAGRCNRNGLLAALGICEVFELADGKSPMGAYRSAIDTTRRFIPDRLSQVGMPGLQAEFTKAFFANTGTDVRVKCAGAETSLQKLREAFDFPQVAKYAALIEETNSVAVKTYAPDRVNEILRSLDFGASPRLAARKLATVSVSLRPNELAKAMKDGLVVAHQSGFHLWVGPYDPQIGIGKGSVFEPEELMA